MAETLTIDARRAWQVGRGHRYAAAIRRGGKHTDKRPDRPGAKGRKADALRRHREED